MLIHGCFHCLLLTNHYTLSSTNHKSSSAPNMFCNIILSPSLPYTLIPWSNSIDINHQSPLYSLFNSMKHNRTYCYHSNSILSPASGLRNNLLLCLFTCCHFQFIDDYKYHSTPPNLRSHIFTNRGIYMLWEERGEPAGDFSTPRAKAIKMKIMKLALMARLSLAALQPLKTQLQVSSTIQFSG